MRAIAWVIVALLLSACDVSRDLSVARFACEQGGPCDLGAGFDAGFAGDGGRDVGGPDLGELEVTCVPGRDCICPPGEDCHLNCPTGACDAICEIGANCRYTCMTANCTIDCRTGSNCNVDCDAFGGCVATCGAGADCEIQCSVLGNPCECTGVGECR